MIAGVGVDGQLSTTEIGLSARPAGDQTAAATRHSRGIYMRNLTRFAALALATAAMASAAARADVVIQQQTTFDVASIKAHGTSTQSTSTDKQRNDTAMQCEGFMSMVCGNMQGADIVRLDKDLRWTLDLKKQEYREASFPTAAQRQAAEQKAREMMAKMQQCPATHTNAAAGPDTSKCEMSPPVWDVKTTDTHQSFVGHDSRLTQVSLTQSCRNKDTGDTCDMTIALDTWLTQDQIDGLDQTRAFGVAYRHKLGLDDANDLVQDRMRAFLAPYADSLKQLGSKTAGLQGYPLKTSVRILFGGEHCAAVKNQTASGGSGNAVGDAGQAAGSAATSSGSNAAGSAAGSAASNAAGSSAAGSVLGSAASAFSSKLVSGLFAKKQSAATPPAATSGGSTLPPGMIQAASFGMETTSIQVQPVPASEFDIPAGFKLIVPKPASEKEFSCPKSGT
jgi:hypothetical protein